MANGGYIKSFDGMRALSLLLIMVYHADLAHFTWVAVQLFFVLSGFLITGILWKDKFKPTTLGEKFKIFWVRRSLRIFPLYFGYLLVLGGIYFVFHFPSYYHTYFPYLVSYTFNYSRLVPAWQGNPLFTHLWTLSIEEQFYLLFPLIIFLCPKRFIKALLPTVIVLAPVIRYFLGEYYKRKGLAPEVVADALYWNTLSHLDAFCLGGIIPVLSLDTRIKKPQWVFIGCVTVAFLAGLVNYFFSGSPLSYWDDYGYNHWLIGNYQHVWHYTCINAVFASLILVFISVHSTEWFPWLRKIFESSWLVRMGKVSYGMYVFHWWVLVYVYEHFITKENVLLKILFFIPYVLTVWLIAELSYRLYESYFIKLKDKFYPAKPAKAGIPAATKDLPMVEPGA